MRHAKSAYPQGVLDHERPLNDRGIADAGAAAQWWASHHPTVDLVLVSDAARTMATWFAIADAISPGELRIVPELYDAHPLTVLRLLDQLDADSVLVIAHNPAMQSVTLRIAGIDPHGYLPALSMKYSTCAIATMSVPRWAGIGDGSGTLTDYAIPRAA